jgi:LysM repeat protein
MKNSFKYILSAAFGLSLVLFGVACGKGDTTVPTSGRVRFYNAVSDAPAAGMDLIIDGTIVNLRNWLTPGTPLPDSTFKYGAGFPISSDSSYFYLTEGNHNVKLNAVGSTVNAFSSDVAVAAGKSYTVFATDTLSKISAVIATDAVLPAVDKKAVFRFAHMVPDGPAVDIARIKGTDTTLVFTNITYKTVTPFIQVDTSASTVFPFKVDYAIRVAGTKTSPRSWTSAAFANGRVYTLVARGFVGKTGTQAINATVITQSR